MNPDNLVVLGVFALISFIIKSVILFNVETKSKVAESFVLLCIFFVMQNAAEFLGYFSYARYPLLGEFLVHLYIASLYFIFPSILILSLAITRSELIRKAQLVLYSISGVFALLHISGLLVTGMEFIGWSMITEPGPLYGLMILYTLGCAGLAVGYLIWQARNNPDYEIRYNSRVNLAAIAPILCIAFTVPTLRAMGFDASTAMVFPVATIAFMFIMLVHTNGNIFWLTMKFKTVMALLTMKSDASVEEILNNIEKMRIQEALKITKGQQKNAARLIDMTPSNLNKKISKYKIGVANI